MAGDGDVIHRKTELLLAAFEPFLVSGSVPSQGEGLKVEIATEPCRKGTWERTPVGIKICRFFVRK